MKKLATLLVALLFAFSLSPVAVAQTSPAGQEAQQPMAEKQKTTKAKKTKKKKKSTKKAKKTKKPKTTKKPTTTPQQQ